MSELNLRTVYGKLKEAELRIAELEAMRDEKFPFDRDTVIVKLEAKVAELEAEKKALRTEYLKLWHAFP